MKRYALFSFYGYYPRGGMSDLYNTYDTPEEAFEAAKGLSSDYREVFDMTTGEQVHES